MQPLPTLAEIDEAANVAAEWLPRTPQLRWPLLCDAVGTEVWLKHENHTPVGAFKVRGGLLARVSDAGRPDWGQIDALGWLAQVLAQQDRVGDALNVLDEALELNEGHQWIRQLRSTLAGAQ